VKGVQPVDEVFQLPKHTSKFMTANKMNEGIRTVGKVRSAPRSRPGPQMRRITELRHWNGGRQGRSGHNALSEMAVTSRLTEMACNRNTDKAIYAGHLLLIRFQVRVAARGLEEQ
jgi:hypothetical protein